MRAEVSSVYLDLRVALVVCELLFVVQGHDTAVGRLWEWEWEVEGSVVHISCRLRIKSALSASKWCRRSALACIGDRKMDPVPRALRALEDTIE